MSHNIVLLVEDNPDDMQMFRRTFSQSEIANHIVVAHLDCLFAAGVWEGRGVRGV